MRKVHMWTCFQVFLYLISGKVAVPVIAVVDGDNVLCGVQEQLAVVGPRPGAGYRISFEFYSEAQALPLFDISLDWTWAS